MKAAICTAYGSPEVLQLQDVAKPTPQDNEVLVRIYAAVVSPSDCAFRKGDPFIVRLIYGLRKPRLTTQGVEFSGEIEAVGKEVKQFHPGTQVFGMSTDKFGAHAEYICLPEDKLLVSKPANVTHAETVAICDGAPTALTFLRDVAHIQRGQTVLINGASGAVGSAGVQLARHFGAEVTGVCSGANVELVKSLGADKVIDYTREDFTQNGQTYDIIFDAVGKRSFPACKRSLTANGVYLSTVPSLAIVFHMFWTTLIGSKKARFATAGLMQNRDNLNFLKELLTTGKLKAVLDRCYSLEQIAEAHRYVDTERKRGNVVIKLRGSES